MPIIPTPFFSFSLFFLCNEDIAMKLLNPWRDRKAMDTVPWWKPPHSEMISRRQWIHLSCSALSHINSAPGRLWFPLLHHLQSEMQSRHTENPCKRAGWRLSQWIQTNDPGPSVIFSPPKEFASCEWVTPCEPIISCKPDILCEYFPWCKSLAPWE
jgi:hypothetical protein